MSFFSATKAKPKLNPLYDFQKTGIDFQTNLLNSGVPDIPAQQIVGMTDTEKQSQDLLKQVMNGGGYFGTGMDEIMKIINGGYDPRTSDLYAGLRNEAGRVQGQGINTINRQSQLGWGNPARGSRTRAVGDYVDRSNNDLLTQLGGMYENERNRQQSLIPTLLGADSAKMGMVSQYGALPRQLEQAQSDAQFKAMYEKLMFPYTTQLQIAKSLAGSGNGIWMNEGGPSDLTTMLGYGQAGANIYATAMGVPSQNKTPTQDFYGRGGM
ncbi:MAG: hypothetical protein Q7T18_05940 [Sedimentisphaerales bacterium]|nr:hypothetical protein [Sedimentisphaerales bacterium]